MERPTNREQRRHPERRDVPQSQEDAGRPSVREQAEPDPRAKSFGHGKKTADKWNQ